MSDFLCETCGDTGRRPHERASGPPVTVDCMCAGSLLTRLAASSPRMESTSATPEQVDLVIELQAVSRVITEHCRQVLTSQGHRWAELAVVLNGAAKACRDQIKPSHSMGNAMSHTSSVSAAAEKSVK